MVKALKDAAYKAIGSRLNPGLITKRKGIWLILTFHHVLPLNLIDRYPFPELAITPEDLAWVIEALEGDFDILPVSQAREALERSPRGRFLSLTFDDGHVDNIEHALPVLERSNALATFYVPTSFVGSSEMIWHDQVGFGWKAYEEDAELREFVDACQNLRDLDSESRLGQYVQYLKGLSPVARATTSLRFAKHFHLGHYPWARLMNWDEIRAIHQSGHEIGSHSCTHELLNQLNPAVARWLSR